MSTRRSILIHAAALPPSRDLEREIISRVGNCTISHTMHVPGDVDQRQLRLYASEYEHAILSLREDTPNIQTTRLMRMLKDICETVDLVLISAACRNGSYRQRVAGVFPQEVIVSSRTIRVA